MHWHHRLTWMGPVGLESEYFHCSWHIICCSLLLSSRRAVCATSPRFPSTCSSCREFPSPSRNVWTKSWKSLGLRWTCCEQWSFCWTSCQASFGLWGWSALTLSPFTSTCSSHCSLPSSWDRNSSSCRTLCSFWSIQGKPTALDKLKASSPYNQRATRRTLVFRTPIQKIIHSLAEHR